MRPSEIISEALNILGPNGEHWGKGDFRPSHDSYCMLGAMSKAAGWDGTPEHILQYEMDKTVIKAADLIIEGLSSIVGWSIADFNDRPGTTFEDVKTVMCKAVKMALEREHPDGQD